MELNLKKKDRKKLFKVTIVNKNAERLPCIIFRKGSTDILTMAIELKLLKASAKESNRTKNQLAFHDHASYSTSRSITAFPREQNRISSTLGFKEILRGSPRNTDILCRVNYNENWKIYHGNGRDKRVNTKEQQLTTSMKKNSTAAPVQREQKVNHVVKPTDKYPYLLLTASLGRHKEYLAKKAEFVAKYIFFTCRISTLQ